MTAVVAEPLFRGVACHNCEKPIRLSKALLDRQGKSKNSDLLTKVFTARCRHCNRESIYSLKEIVDCRGDSRARDGI